MRPRCHWCDHHSDAQRSSIMSVNAATIRELQAMPFTDYTSDPLLPLLTVEAVYAFEIARARAGGEDECDAVELIARAANESPAAVRHSARLLRKLGYIKVADRLVEIAGRRKNELLPLA